MSLTMAIVNTQTTDDCFVLISAEIVSIEHTLWGGERGRWEGGREGRGELIERREEGRGEREGRNW